MGKVGAVSETEYKQYHNILNNTIKQSKESYYKAEFTNFNNNTRKIWTTINQLCNNNRKSNIPTHMLYNNKKLSEPLHIANAFNYFYTNISPKLDQILPIFNNDPLSYLQGDYPDSMTVPLVITFDVIDVINSL